MKGSKKSGVMWILLMIAQGKGGQSWTMQVVLPISLELKEMYGWKVRNRNSIFSRWSDFVRNFNDTMTHTIS